MNKYAFLILLALLQGCGSSPVKNERISVKKECPPIGSHTTAQGMIDEGVYPIQCVKNKGIIINGRIDQQIKDAGGRSTNPYGR